MVDEILLAFYSLRPLFHHASRPFYPLRALHVRSSKKQRFTNVELVVSPAVEMKSIRECGLQTTNIDELVCSNCHAWP